MKGIKIFYEDKNSLFKDEKIFDGKSSVELCNNWANKINNEKVVTICEKKNVTELLASMLEEAQKNDADYIIFSFNDLPFLNLELTNKLIDYHTKFHAEYTFADGYSKGLAPEIIHTGTLSILLELSKSENNLNNLSLQKISRDCIFNLIKTDINAFEIETVLADTDFRLFRFNFDCSNKLNFITCKNLFNEIKDKKVNFENIKAEELNEIACQSLTVLKTVPSFYNIQISDKCSGKCIYCPYPKQYEKINNTSVLKSDNFMSFDKVDILLKKIVNFSQKAVVSFSLWGEPFLNPDLIKILEKTISYKDLSVFLETDGLFLNEEVYLALEKILKNTEKTNGEYPKMMIAVSLDSFTNEMYKKIRGTEKSLDDAINVIKRLSQIEGVNVYPQFVRMNYNEQELESFFRFWKDQANFSKGQFIIQKYDNFAGLLPSEKTADLTPIQRNVCWHLRRDMNILTNGDVLLCKEFILDNKIGNVFEDDLESIWEKSNNLVLQQITNKFENKCGDCDEFYTYNF